MIPFERFLQLPTAEVAALGALTIARAIDGAVDDIGPWCEANGVEAWYTKAGSLPSERKTLPVTVPSSGWRVIAQRSVPMSLLTS